jgi:hypothetical protein
MQKQLKQLLAGCILFVALPATAQVTGLLRQADTLSWQGHYKAALDRLNQAVLLARQHPLADSANILNYKVWNQYCRSLPPAQRPVTKEELDSLLKISHLVVEGEVDTTTAKLFTFEHDMGTFTSVAKTFAGPQRWQRVLLDRAPQLTSIYKNPGAGLLYAAHDSLVRLYANELLANANRSHIVHHSAADSAREAARLAQEAGVIKKFNHNQYFNIHYKFSCISCLPAQLETARLVQPGPAIFFLRHTNNGFELIKAVYQPLAKIEEPLFNGVVQADVYSYLYEKLMRRSVQSFYRNKGNFTRTTVWYYDAFGRLRWRVRQLQKTVWYRDPYGRMTHQTGVVREKWRRYKAAFRR